MLKLKLISFSAVRFVLLPSLMAFSIFYLVPPIFAQNSDEKVRLSQYLAAGNQLETGKTTDETGYGQIYYSFEGKKTTITNDTFTHSDPGSNNGFVVWTGQIDGLWQVFLHNAISGTTIQLTKTGNHSNPKVSASGKVVWEGWVEEGWQIFLFEGSKIRQITQGDLSVRPAIEGEYVVYARKNAGGLWRSEAYSIAEDRSLTVDFGNESEYPNLVNGDIFVGPPLESQEKYPLKVQDLFLLNIEDTQMPDITPVLSVEDELLPINFSDTATESAEPVRQEIPSITPTRSPSVTPSSFE